MNAFPPRAPFTPVPGLPSGSRRQIVCWRTALLCCGLPAALLTGVSAAWAQPHDCLIEPFQTVDVGSPLSGLLDRVTVKRGDRVTKGQTVATLESRAEQASAELARYKSEISGPSRSAESKIEFSKKKFLRRKDMAAEKHIPAQERDDAESDLRLAEAELQIAKENRQIAKIEFQQQSGLLNLRTIRSPFDGVVTDQMLYPGEIVETSGAKKGILKLAQLSPLRVRAILPMAAFGKVAIGASAEVQPEAPVGGKYPARVTAIDRLVDAASGTFLVFLDLPNPKLEIPAGIKCKAAFTDVKAAGAVSAPPARPSGSSPSQAAAKKQ